MPESNANARLEAFSDGVFAIALTLLIIDVRLPATAQFTSSVELWRALWHLMPTMLAFLLSFGIILITWVNHHGAFSLVSRSTPSFVYANGVLLLTVVLIPFPTALLGEFLLTDHAAPAVVVYDGVLAVQALSWVLVISAALKNHLLIDAQAIAAARDNKQKGYFALVFYALLAVLALWIPLPVAIVTLVSWIFWLILGARLKRI
ncbi:MAG TPA: TMEM175 family protein [Gemmatimonadales bacterium]